jgi:NAD(P)-dependent dehydrogenase (short-subunit alcohol dehydrogenase family)
VHYLGPFRLDGKVAVVTGGASGIGRAVCELFARQGAIVEILDVNAAAVTQTAKEISAEPAVRRMGSGARVTARAVNLCDEAAVFAAFQSIHAARGGVHILVNNAGVGSVGTVMEATGSEMDKCYNVNVKGIFHCVKATIPIMKASGGGSIVNLASIASTIGLKDRFAYQASKGAVLALTLSIATDYVRDNIRCNCVAPARIHTPFVDAFLKKNYAGKEAEVFKTLSEYQPIGRMGKPAEVAALILYLASDEAAFCTGANYAIDGGVTAKM